MLFNVIIYIDDKEKLLTDCFYYNAENHYLNYHSPYQDKDGWVSVPNVECEIKVELTFDLDGKPLEISKAQKYKEKEILYYTND